MITPAVLGPLGVLGTEVVGGVTIIEFVLLGLVVANLLARAIAHRTYVATAREDGADAVTRSLFLEVTNVLIVLGGFFYITVHLHGGVIFTVLALGLLVTDFFEFEARLVEARTEIPLERPKGALVASSLVFLYIAYQSLFFIIRPLWELVV
ncbi:DUF7313 family protein [Natrononativus amylolyticus]|uniref:DUF7313 family protein n=1 Tax=Natrononativus amylolyticus TaxID=2963434 RepID=UPI0020CC727D|nr:hypothetical protein [Natrononativus amylolyticus]